MPFRGGFVQFTFRENDPKAWRGLPPKVDGSGVGLGDTIADTITLNHITDHIAPAKAEVTESIQAGHLD